MSEVTRTDGERMVRQFELCNLVLVLLAVIITHLVLGPGLFLWGVLVGGGLGVLNLFAMAFLGRRIIESRHRSRALWAVLFAFKLVVLGTVVWLCLDTLPIHPLGFLVGFSTVLPATLVLTAIRALERAPTAAAPGQGERRP